MTIKPHVATRPDLAREKGDEFYQNCSKCGTDQKIHVNEVRARQNSSIIIGGVIISLAVTFILLFAIGLIGTITMVIPTLIWKQQQSSVHGFNSYLITR